MPSNPSLAKFESASASARLRSSSDSRIVGAAGLAMGTNAEGGAVDGVVETDNCEDWGNSGVAAGCGFFCGAGAKPIPLNALAGAVGLGAMALFF